jgi:hypothetical protein
LSEAGSTYREMIYNLGFSGKKVELNFEEIRNFVKVTLTYFEHTIAANKRADNLHHAYNLLVIHPNKELSINYLSEMLEGQVAAISSGFLNSQETVLLLDGLRESKLYRPDQKSYLLYPNKELAGFFAKNYIPKSLIEQSKLLESLIQENNHQIIIKDVKGDCHFNGNFKNAGDLSAALNQLEDTSFSELMHKERALVLRIFEDVFKHKSFTGRSGTFYAYEGLGSIYWHMVSKLYLAVQEACTRAINEKADADCINRLLRHFYEIGDGIGIHKNPQLYGAFPTDPYSHTPVHRGAQQPGMTGQVKEDILVRIAELGVSIIDGQLCFNPSILRKEEFLKSAIQASFIDRDNNSNIIHLKENTLGFTVCQVPVIYVLSQKQGLEVEMTEGIKNNFNSLMLDKSLSDEVFKRTGKVVRITVFVTISNEQGT